MSEGATRYSLIMAGGQGTRFWPESTSKKPKQYLSLTSSQSLLEETLLRFEGLVERDHNYIVTVKAQKELAQNCSGNLIGKNGLIFEPAGRNTAPCILLAMAKLEAQGAKDSDVMAIVPSDHVILNTKGFQQTLTQAYKLAEGNNKIVTIGIKPHFPHTGYGYIKKGSDIETNCFAVDSFVEKPDVETAKSYLATGSYYWNAGMFVTSLGTLKAEFQTHAADMYEFYQALKEGNEEETAATYEKLRKESIDYAVMEKSQNVFVLEAGFDWNDLGSWDALETVLEKQKGNTIVGHQGEYVNEAEGNIIFAPKKFVCLQHVKDLIVVSNDDVLMVLPKDKAQDVKKAVEAIKSTEYSEKLL